MYPVWKVRTTDAAQPTARAELNQGAEWDEAATIREVYTVKDGEFVSTLAPEEPDSAALDKLKRITA